MERRILGKTDLAISHIGLGCVTFGREIGEDQSFEIMDYAYEHGINLFDTAEAYIYESHGQVQSSEAIIGKWMQRHACSSSIILQSKVAAPLNRMHILETIRRSLDRLRTKYIDIVLFHTFDASSPLEESLEALAEARENGYIRFGGCSNFTVEQLRTALLICDKLGLPRFETVEPIYNLVHRSIEQDLLPYCAEQQLGVTAYSPLGAGFLSGKHTGDPQDIAPGSRFALKPGHQRLYYTSEGFQALSGLRHLASMTGVPLSQLALAWALRRSDITSVLVGARSAEHVHNAIVASRITFSEEWESALCFGTI